MLCHVETSCQRVALANLPTTEVLFGFSSGARRPVYCTQASLRLCFAQSM